MTTKKRLSREEVLGGLGGRATKQASVVLALIENRTAQMIAQAEGWLGSCAEYLFSTVQHLDELGVADGPMHELKRLVEQYQQA